MTAPTAEALARALALIDETMRDVDDPTEFRGAMLMAVLDVAEAAVAYEQAAAAVMAPDGPWTGEARAAVHKALDDAHAAKIAAVARLAALAAPAEAVVP